VRKQDTATSEAPARLSALSVLVFGGPMTLGGLAAAEQVKPPTMTRIVTGLERNGLAERVPDPDDGRRLSIRATAKGVRLLHGARKLRVDYLAAQLDRLPVKECAALGEAVEILDRLLREWE
jgi:DNA-binding MarR family transcriptional regulator